MVLEMALLGMHCCVDETCELTGRSTGEERARETALLRLWFDYIALIGCSIYTRTQICKLYITYSMALVSMRTMHMHSFVQLNRRALRKSMLSLSPSARACTCFLFIYGITNECWRIQTERACTAVVRPLLLLSWLHYSLTVSALMSILVVQMS